jgi:hypothetical protein
VFVPQLFKPVADIVGDHLVSFWYHQFELTEILYLQFGLSVEFNLYRSDISFSLLADYGRGNIELLLLDLFFYGIGKVLENHFIETLVEEVSHDTYRDLALSESRYRIVLVHVFHNFALRLFDFLGREVEDEFLDVLLLLQKILFHLSFPPFRLLLAVQLYLSIPMARLN